CGELQERREIEVFLAKQHLDLGLYTNQREGQLAFWQQTAGLEFDHIGKLGVGCTSFAIT
ncbi:MAG: hypothetical protein NZ936_22035, partial [Alphaproteobacteria bacterium]|nr:hypothetical protein [Alphaproteobacteria bacterium]